MTRPIHLAVFGVPEPMGSKRARTNGSRSWVVDAKPIALRSWQGAIAQAARDWIVEHSPNPRPLDRPLTVRACFYLPRPQSAPGWRVWPDKRPDVDKCLRAVLDPLTGILWRDDSLIVRAKVTKRYADTRPPGVDITITPLGAQLSPRAKARVVREEGV